MRPCLIGEFCFIGVLGKANKLLIFSVQVSDVESVIYIIIAKCLHI